MEGSRRSWRPQRVSSKPARSVDLVDLKKTFGISFRDGEDDDTDSSDAEFAPENECIDSEDSCKLDEDDSTVLSSSQALKQQEENGGGEDIRKKAGHDQDKGNDQEKEEIDRRKESSDQEKEGSDREKEESDLVKEESDEEKEGSDREKEESDEVKEGNDREREESDLVKGGNDREREGSDQEKEASDQVKEGSDREKEGSDDYNPLVVRRSQRAIKPSKDVDLYLLGAKFGIDVEGSDADSSDQEFAPERNSEEGSVSSDSSDSEGGASEKEQQDPLPDVGDGVGVAVEETRTSENHMLELLLCCVCLEDSGEEGDLVECDKCGIAVHEGCYGVVEEEDTRDDRSDLSSFTTVPWFCDPCRAGLQATLCCCELCPTKGGLFKQTIHGSWVHMVCALYTPSIEYVEPRELCGVTLDQMPTGRWGGKVCQLCEELQLSKTGVCISCDAGLCKSSFHVTCAQRHGLLCEVEDNEDTDKDEFCEPFFAHCKAHADKDLMKRKRRDFLSILKRQRQVLYEDMEDRTKHYLEEAQVRYKELFDKMQSYYQPEKGFRGEDRWLHHVPNGLQLLTKKAQLLGHVTEVLSVETRWKVAPGLTVDFVKYFQERQKLMESLNKQLSTLQETSRQLHEDQAHVKNDHSLMKEKLDVLKSDMKVHLDHLVSLDQHMAKLGLEQGCILLDGDKEPRDEDIGEGMAGVCVVCEKSEEEHLMVTCDSCHLHYHIHCLDPPLTKVPKKTAKWGWQCHQCTRNSDDDLVPVIPNFDEPSSRSGRRLKAPKSLSYDDHVKTPKKKKARLS